MKILLTGFEPFGGESINPAWEALREIPEVIEGHHVIKLQIPTLFHKAAESVIEKINREEPDIVICVGQAGGRPAINVEFVAINYADAKIPDNEGNQPVDKAILADGENAYFSSLPVREIVKHLHAHQLPATVSYTAGTYVCNEVLYHVLHHSKHHHPDLRAGFIHVPFSTDQIADKDPGIPSMPLEEITKSLVYAIEACITN